MKPWLTLGEAAAPDGTPLVLQQRSKEFVIRAGGQVLMTSRSHRSEEHLVTFTVPGLTAPRPRILIGGLGMGFTLRMALDHAPEDAELVVSELIPAVVAWNRGPLAPLARWPLDDVRVRVVVGDVGELVARSEGQFDAILLDVDNGPAALTQQQNARLYGERALRQAGRALRKDGVLAIWSAAADAGFLKRLGELGFDARCEEAGGKHAIFVARRREG